MFKNALVSCSNKDGLAPFIKELQSQGMRVVSTGGTAKYLREHGIEVIDVSEQTQFPEVMGGRVKTLHPHIHMALLSRQNHTEDNQTLKQYDLKPFDLVVGNLYPFESDPDIENIDIGGPSFLRAAAKNHERITVVCNPSDYAEILQKKELNLRDRKILAAKVFAHTAAYDSLIAGYLADDQKYQFNELTLGGRFVKALRYGENPQQQASWYRLPGSAAGLHQARILQGKELSYNNILDLDAATSTLSHFAEPTCVAVKHNNPCGVASGQNALQAVQDALAADPQSVFGGVLAVNFEVDDRIAEVLNRIFLECILAPKFTNDAITSFTKKKNLRILEWAELGKSLSTFQYRTIRGGFLLQSSDQIEIVWDSSWLVIGESIAPEIQADLVFAMAVCAHLKSNAIAIAKNKQTLGLGMGQVNRVDAVQHAIERMKQFHPNVQNAVLASDAFFPFPDSIKKIAAAGIRYVIQPGGSIKDEEIKQAALELGVTMVLTGRRHFLH